jgi:hypothetical protein
LAALGSVILFVVVEVFAALTETGGMRPYTDYISMPVILCFCGAAVVLQYARRMAWRSRVLLATALVLVGVVDYVSSSPTVIARAYPEPASANEQLQVAPDSNGGHSPPSDMGGSKVAVTVPLTFSGIADGYAVMVDGVKATIETQDGKKWTSSWVPNHGPLAMPENSSTALSVQMGRAFFNEAQPQPVKVQMKLALTILEAGEDQRIVATGGEFAVPELGICSLVREGSELADTQVLACRAAMREPKLTYVSVRWAEVACAAAPDEITGTGSVGVTIGDLSRDPGEFGISSVRTTQAWLGNRGSDVEREGKILHTRRFLCPGTPVHFTRYTVVGRWEYDVTIDNFKLPEWQR